MRPIIIFLAIFLTSSFANAQTSSRWDNKEGEYGYAFEDDPLNAYGFGPSDTTIKVRPLAARIMLLRPRTNFILNIQGNPRL